MGDPANIYNRVGRRGLITQELITPRWHQLERAKRR